MVNVQELRKWSGLVGVLCVTVGAILGPSMMGAKELMWAGVGFAALAGGLGVFFFPVVWIPWHEKCIDAEVSHMAEILVVWVDYGDGWAEIAVFAFPEFDVLTEINDISDITQRENFRKFVRWESLEKARVMKIGNPILPKIKCPSKDCKMVVDAGTEACPACGTAFPKPAPVKVYCPNKECRLQVDQGVLECPTCKTKMPSYPIFRKTWKTPEDVTKEIETALTNVASSGGITVGKGKLRRPWVRMDGRDWWERCSIVIPKAVDWDAYFGKPLILMTPFYEFGMMVTVKCHFANVVKICNSEAGVPLFKVKDTAFDVHKHGEEVKQAILHSNVAISALCALNAAENKDVAVVQEREDKVEAQNMARFWKHKYTLKQVELDTVTGQRIKLPAERSNRLVVGLFLCALGMAIFAFLSIWQAVVG